MHLSMFDWILGTAITCLQSSLNICIHWCLREYTVSVLSTSILWGNVRIWNNFELDVMVLSLRWLLFLQTAWPEPSKSGDGAHSFHGLFNSMLQPLPIERILEKLFCYFLIEVFYLIKKKRIKGRKKEIKVSKKHNKSAYGYGNGPPFVHSQLLILIKDLRQTQRQNIHTSHFLWVWTQMFTQVQNSLYNKVFWILFIHLIRIEYANMFECIPLQPP